MLVLVFLFAGFLVMLDQFVSIGIWFQFQDIHHETFAFSFFALAVGIVIGWYLPKKQS